MVFSFYLDAWKYTRKAGLPLSDIKAVWGGIYREYEVTPIAETAVQSTPAQPFAAWQREDAVQLTNTREPMHLHAALRTN